jgi:hypothetical protein
MQATFAKSGALVLAMASLALVFPGLRAASARDDAKGAPADKGQPATVADWNAKLKAGVFKLTEADVVKLLGRPTAVKQPGDAGSPLQMEWEYATYIFATFKDGKLGEVTGAFSEHLPCEKVSLAHFKRLRLAMTEAEVVEVLGTGNGVVKVGGTAVRSWGRTARLWVSFNAKGLAFNRGFHEESAVSAPPGFQLPVPPAVKP